MEIISLYNIIININPYFSSNIKSLRNINLLFKIRFN